MFGQREPQNGIMVSQAEVQVGALRNIPDCFCLTRSLRDRGVVLKSPQTFILQ